MGVSKVIYGNQTLIDLTNDSVTADKLLRGYTAHGKNGELIEGTCAFNANTNLSADVAATADEILTGKYAFVNGLQVKGAMPYITVVDETLTSKKVGKVMIPRGYHDGSTCVELEPEEVQALVPENLREGMIVLGVVGTMTGLEDVKAQAKTVTPKANQQQVIVPDAPNYNYLAQVTVAAIPYAETNNDAGGKTVTIG